MLSLTSKQQIVYDIVVEHNPTWVYVPIYPSCYSSWRWNWAKIIIWKIRLWESSYNVMWIVEYSLGRILAHEIENRYTFIPREDINLMSSCQGQDNGLYSQCSEGK